MHPVFSAKNQATEKFVCQRLQIHVSPKSRFHFFFYRNKKKKTKHKKFCPFLHGLYSMNMTFWTYISSRKKTAINAKISLCKSFSLNPSSFFLHCFSFSRSASISAFKGIVYGQTNFQIKPPFLGTKIKSDALILY